MRRHPTVTVSGLAAIVTLLAAVTLGTVLVQRERVKALAATRLAADNAPAAEAETLAAQKEVEATRLAREANEARLQASNFSAVARLAMAEADAARTRVTQLETQLESRTQREDSLEQQLEAARGKLAAAQSRAATEAARAAGSPSPRRTLGARNGGASRRSPPTPGVSGDCSPCRQPDRLWPTAGTPSRFPRRRTSPTRLTAFRSCGGRWLDDDRIVRCRP